MARPKNQISEVSETKEEKIEEVVEKTPSKVLNGEFIYETNGIKYKKIFKDGVIVERVRI